MKVIQITVEASKNNPQKLEKETGKLEIREKLILFKVLKIFLGNCHSGSSDYQWCEKSQVVKLHK